MASPLRSQIYSGGGAVFIGDGKGQFVGRSVKAAAYLPAVAIADFNLDGIQDIACVSDSFEGISSDTMAENLWFINIKGEWKVIDWGRQLDCT